MKDPKEKQRKIDEHKALMAESVERDLADNLSVEQKSDYEKKSKNTTNPMLSQHFDNLLNNLS